MKTVVSGQLSVVSKCGAADIFNDAGSADLFAEYEAECANLLLGACAPDQAKYERLEALGMAQCFGAYAGETLAGFAFVIKSEIPHYGERRRYAVAESLFVTPGERGGGLGGLLMKAVDDYAREAGCESILYSAPVGSKLARLLFLSADLYTNTAHVFTRRLR